MCCRRIAKIPVDAVAGTKHVIGIVPLNLDLYDAKDNTDSILLRFSNQEQVRQKHFLSHSLCGCLHPLMPDYFSSYNITKT